MTAETEVELIAELQVQDGPALQSLDGTTAEKAKQEICHYLHTTGMSNGPF